MYVINAGLEPQPSVDTQVYFKRNLLSISSHKYSHFVAAMRSNTRCVWVAHQLRRLSYWHSDGHRGSMSGFNVSTACRIMGWNGPWHSSEISDLFADTFGASLKRVMTTDGIPSHIHSDAPAFSTSTDDLIWFLHPPEPNHGSRTLTFPLLVQCARSPWRFSLFFF